MWDIYLRTGIFGCAHYTTPSMVDSVIEPRYRFARDNPERNVTVMLEEFGIEMLNGEQMRAQLESRRGFSESQRKFRSGLILTNNRLISVKRNERERSAWAAALTDVRFIEIQQVVRSRWLLAFAVLLTPILIGLILLWIWWRSGLTMIRTRIDGITMSAAFGRSARSDTKEFIKAFFIAKSEMQR